MRSILNLLALSLFAHAASSTAILLPRDPRGGGRSGSRGGDGITGGTTGGDGGISGGSGGGGGGGSSSDTMGTGSSTGSTGHPADTSTYHQGSSTSAGTGRGKSGDTGDDPIPYYSLDSTDRDANFFSSGGGGRFTLSGTSTFAGRQVGGGKRSEVLGTRSYGSGYPYTAQDIRTYGVAGQPFPFGFWPLYWYGWGHSGEYGGNATIEWERPGDSQVIVKLVPGPTTAWSNTTLGNNTLYMIGDRDSVTTVLSLLIDPHDYYSYGCSVKDLYIVDMNWYTPPNIQFDNVIQYYRSSSFALAFDGYNNTNAVAPLNATAGLDWSDSTPLPAILVSSPFMDCVNRTIIAALPIIDAEPPFTLPLGAIIGIVIGSLSGLLGLVMCVCCCIRVKRAVSAQRAAGAAAPTSLASSHPDMSTQTPSGAPPVFRFPGADQTATAESQPMIGGFRDPSMMGASSYRASLSMGGSRRGSLDSAKTPGPEQLPAYGHY